MACRTAYLLRKPEVCVTTEVQRTEYNTKTKKWDKWTEVLVVPDYSVTCTYDYGSCCGIDDDTQHFASQEAAEQFITDLMDGKVSWIIVDEEFMKDWAEDEQDAKTLS